MRASDLPEAERDAHWERIRHSLEVADEANARLAEGAEERQAAIRAERMAEWQRGREERERAQQRQAGPAPRQRSPAPPMPDKVQIPVHDPATGRVTAIKTYDGHASVSAAVSWEGWVRAEIRQYVERRLTTAADAMAGFAGEVGDDVGKLKKQLGEQAAAITRLAEQLAASDEKLAELERRAAPQPGRPRLVGDESNAA